MRRGYLVAAGGLAAVVLATYVGAQWMQSRATGEFTRTVEAVRSSGARIEHGAPRVSLWSRSLTVEAIVLSLPGETDQSVRIGRLVAHGIRPGTPDLDASRLELTGIEIEHGLAGLKDASVRLKIPSATAEAVLIPGALATAGEAPFKTAAAFLERFRAGAIRIPQVEAKAALPALAVTPGPRGSRPGGQGRIDTFDYTYRDVAFERIADGRIGAVSMGETAFSGSVGSGRMERLVAKDIDVMPLLRAGLDRRKPVGAYYSVYGSFSGGRLTAKLPDGGEIAIGSMLGTGIAVDPDRLSSAAWADMMKQMPSSNQVPTADQTAALLDMVGRIYQGMKFDEISLRDMRIRTPAMPKADMGLGAIVLLGMADGKLKQMRFDGLDVPVPMPTTTPGPGADRVKIGSFAVNDLDFVKLMQFAAFANPLQRPRGQALTAPIDPMSLLSGIEISDTVVPDFGSGRFTIDAFRTSWGRFVSGVPADLRLELRGKMPLPPRNPTVDLMREHGLTEIAGDLEMTSRYQPESREMVMEVAKMSFARLGSIEGKVALGNISPRTYAALATSFDAHAGDLTVRSIELRLADDGFNTIFSKLLASSMAPSAPPPFKALKEALIEPGQPGGNLGAILDALERFLATPSQKLHLKLAPSETVGLQAFRDPTLLGIPGPLARLLERFALDVRVTK